MQMTHTLHSKAAEDLFEHFTSAIESGDHSAALVHAMQIMSEASEQMKVILANAQLRAALHSESAMLVHIASRRTLQSEELRVFLQEVNDRITTASKSRSATSAGFTASWVDFIAGWLSKQDTDLVEPSSLEQVTRTAQTPSAAAHATSQHTTPPAGPTARPAQSGVGTGGGSGAGAAGGGPGGGGGSSATPLPKFTSFLKFRRQIPCSPDVIGQTLGVDGSPQCKKCKQGAHYHGECPKEWGAAGVALPGFSLDGKRLPTQWNMKAHEPIQKTVKAWVAFLKNHTNFENNVPLVAGVPGAPDLDGFVAQALVAPVKP